MTLYTVWKLRCPNNKFQSAKKQYRVVQYFSKLQDLNAYLVKNPNCVVSDTCPN